MSLHYYNETPILKEGLKMKTILRELRKKNHITQRKLANDLHISQTSVSKYERKESLPDLEMAVKIADYFGVSLDDFIRNYINL